MTQALYLLRLAPGLYLKADTLSRGTTTDRREAKVFQSAEGAMRALQAVREAPPSRAYKGAGIVSVGPETGGNGGG